MPHDHQSANQELADSLLTWYRANRRDLPWRRRQDDPYAVWISEIMLQQTTVSAVVGFYNRWMERFPNVFKLADAPLDDVLLLWAGLGYYARARNIKKTAEIVVREFGGVFPSSVDELINLPGIGRYTAGAISSIAFNQNAPILDVNVTRVLCRVNGLLGETKSPIMQSDLWRLATEIIPDGRARDFNQAMMELGATICSPKAPNCESCPIFENCRAMQSGTPEKFPGEPMAKSWTAAVHVAVAVSREDGKLLIVRRPETGVWAGLWELPRIVVADGETNDDAATRALDEIAGVVCSDVLPFGTVKHVVMDTKIVLHGYAANECGAESSLTDPGVQTAWIYPSG